jgi:UDP-N-acetylmuramate--alanine ligase
VLIDDYAHHPTEIAAVHQAVKEMHPRKKVLAISSLTCSPGPGILPMILLKALSKFDEVRLLDIYPAREKPIEGITSEWLLGKIENDTKKLISAEDIVAEIEASQAKVVIVMMGAGNIGEMINKVTEKLANED